MGRTRRTSTRWRWRRRGRFRPPSRAPSSAQPRSRGRVRPFNFVHDCPDVRLVHLDLVWKKDANFIHSGARGAPRDGPRKALLLTLDPGTGTSAPAQPATATSEPVRLKRFCMAGGPDAPARADCKRTLTPRVVLRASASAMPRSDRNGRVCAPASATGVLGLSAQSWTTDPTAAAPDRSQLRLELRLRAPKRRSPSRLAVSDGRRTRESALFRLAEDRGFEPLRALTQHAFQACALGHYANPPPQRLSPAPPSSESAQTASPAASGARIGG
jgi:hypothetical protein